MHIPKFVPGHPPGPWSGKTSTNPILMMSYDGFWHVTSKRSWFAPCPQYVTTLVFALALKAADAEMISEAAAVRNVAKCMVRNYASVLDRNVVNERTAAAKRNVLTHKNGKGMRGRKQVFAGTTTSRKAVKTDHKRTMEDLILGKWTPDGTPSPAAVP